MALILAAIGFACVDAGAQSAIAWGGNTQGECIVPPTMPGVTYVEVSAGYGHTLGRRSDGVVLAWGLNNFGQCTVPPLPQGLSYVEVDGGFFFSIARRSDGSVIGWGSNTWGHLNVPPLPAGLAYAEVATGEVHAVARRSDGSVVAWGDNAYGQCNVPPLPGASVYIQVAAGNGHSLAIRSDGALIAWGDNGAGQCDVPPLPPGVIYLRAAAGFHHSAALRSDGQIVAWGNNADGQCNVVPLPPGVLYVEVATGNEFMAGRRDDGTVVCWGNNGAGQCDVPPIPGGRFDSIEAGWYHVVARVSGPANGSVLYVPAEFGSIQAAINASSPGDTVLVADGTYFESIDFLGKAITVTSARGADVTTIDANDQARVVSFQSGEGPGSVLEGFTITNGLSWGPLAYESLGGGIRCWYASPTIRNCRIVGNRAGPGWAPGGNTGGGIMTFAGAPLIDSCIIANNSAGLAGGAVHFREPPGPTMVNCIVTGNTALDCGGIDVWALAVPSIINCTIVGNTATSGGGIQSGGGPGGGAFPSVVNSIVWGNSPTQIFLNTAGQIQVTHSDVQGGYPGIGNQNADPAFVAGGLPWHLGPLSPCRNAGTSLVAGLPVMDFEGEPRVVGAGIDIGADEYPSVSDAVAIATRPLLLGRPASILVGSPSPNAPIYVFLDIATGSVPLGIWGHTQVALSPALIPLAAPTSVFGPSLTVPYTNPSGTWSLSAIVPNEPLLAGIPFYCEAYVLDFFAPNGLLRQTNLLTLIPK